MTASLLLTVLACGGSYNAQPDSGSAASAPSCTWETDGEACHPSTPADRYDLDAIRGYSLDDLGWQPGETWSDETGSVITGDITTPFAAFDVAGDAVDVEMRSRVALYLPAGWPEGIPDAAVGKGMVVAAHYASDVISEVPASIAQVTGIPVLYHGEYTENWTQLGYDTRSALNQASNSHLATANPCEPVDIVRGSYEHFMAGVDMRAMTLLQRLAEGGGGSVDRFALRGFSKEGMAAWQVLLVDDRVVVGSPGGHPEEDQLVAYDNWVDAVGCDGDSADQAVAEYKAKALDWALHTPAGAAVLNSYDVEVNKERLLPRVLLIDGDVHLPGMHDGDNFMLGSETPFLDGLAGIDWRYARKSVVDADSLEDAGDTVSTTVVPFLVAELLMRDDPVDDYYPKVLDAQARVDGGQLTVSMQASAPTASGSLLWSWSDDRIFNDEDQAAWEEVPMTLAGDTWTATVDLAALGVQDKVIGWYAQASNVLAVGDAEYTRKDGSPIHFLQLTAAAACDIETTDDCADAGG